MLFKAMLKNGHQVFVDSLKFHALTIGDLEAKYRHKKTHKDLFH